MKYLIILCAITSIGLLFAGLYFDIQGEPIKDKMYGFGTMGLFLITFPLFLYWRRKKITLDKYTWQNPKDKLEDRSEN